MNQAHLNHNSIPPSNSSGSSVSIVIEAVDDVMGTTSQEITGLTIGTKFYSHTKQY